jgi:hypothetical protein
VKKYTFLEYGQGFGLWRTPSKLDDIDRQGRCPRQYFRHHILGHAHRFTKKDAAAIVALK